MKPSTANAFIGKGLSGTLSKQSPAFPYPWQKREVEVVGEAIMYKAGGGAQKAISVREIKAIRMTDAVKFEFEVVTRNRSYKFRGSRQDERLQWASRGPRRGRRRSSRTSTGCTSCAGAASGGRACR